MGTREPGIYLTRPLGSPLDLCIPEVTCIVTRWSIRVGMQPDTHTHTHTHDVSGQHDIDRIALCITGLCPLRLSCDSEAFCTGLPSHLVHVFVVLCYAEWW